MNQFDTHAKGPAPIDLKTYYTVARRKVFHLRIKYNLYNIRISTHSNYFRRHFILSIISSFDLYRLIANFVSVSTLEIQLTCGQPFDNFIQCIILALKIQFELNLNFRFGILFLMRKTNFILIMFPVLKPIYLMFQSSLMKGKWLMFQPKTLILKRSLKRRLLRSSLLKNLESTYGTVNEI